MIELKEIINYDLSSDEEKINENIMNNTDLHKKCIEECLI